MRLLRTAFSSEEDELKRAREPVGRTPNLASPYCNDVIFAEFQGTNHESIAIYES